MQKIKILLLILILVNLPEKTYSQNENAETALMVGAAAFQIWKAIDDYQEYYESVATDFILSNYPEYDQFRLKLMNLSSGKKASDKGGMNVLPFSLTILSNGAATNNRRLLLMFSSSKQINNFGVSHNEFHFKILDVEEWNNIISAYSNLSSPIETESITDNSIPIYKKTNSLSEATVIIKKYGTDDEVSSEFLYVKNDDEPNIDIGNISIGINGLKNKGKIIYPFLNLKGDDYLVNNFSNEFKIIANEKSMGLHIIEAKESILIKRRLVNKIHSFLNIIQYEDSE
tara:strand:- start:99 stop:956 length:858 start_codon:yes stop_codon:yes gene_type:complete